MASEQEWQQRKMNVLAMDDIDLIIEHQANFAMIPLTLKQIFESGQKDLKAVVAEVIADKMVTNIHVRGNCSVVCMQRIPYDLQRAHCDRIKSRDIP